MCLLLIILILFIIFKKKRGQSSFEAIIPENKDCRFPRGNIPIEKDLNKWTLILKNEFSTTYKQGWIILKYKGASKKKI